MDLLRNLRFVHAARLRNLRALLVGEDLLVDAGLGILLFEPLHHQLEGTLWGVRHGLILPCC